MGLSFYVFLTGSQGMLLLWPRGMGLYHYPLQAGTSAQGSLNAQGVGVDMFRPLALQSSSLWSSLGI